MPLRFLFGLIIVCLFAPLPATAGRRAGKGPQPAASEAAGGGAPSIEEKVAGFERSEGLLTFFSDREEGRIWLELPAPHRDQAGGKAGLLGRFLYTESLTTGLGSNPVGLDRGQLGRTRLIAFRDVGGKVLVEEENLRFRVTGESPAEGRAVRESFATSVLWAVPVAAKGGDGRLLIDLTSFLVRDAHGIVRRLKESEQGAFALDRERSVVDLDACHGFPDNLELEALLTYGASADGSEVGDWVRETAPTARAITLVQHHSLARLPDDGFRSRAFDPRAGSFGVGFRDYGVALDEPVDGRWLARHRLEKLDPTAPSSRVKKPIVFYVDPGAPEPVRSALLEGAGWWVEAFEQAGFLDAFRVELLPAGAHPLDLRFNVIQWVHRSTRGWSYGDGVIDPRSGEILKGHVSLGSLRVRQDRLLFEGLAGVAKTGTGAPDDPVEMALARIRQLAAHEVGHALGLAHNFAASTYGRASVMDYPAPRVGVGEDGELDFSSVYGVGIGAWDRHAIRYAYSETAPGAEEAAGLESMIREARREGLLFLSDDDARPPGAAEPRAGLWDNGSDPVAELARVMAVRRKALGRFGEGNLAPGRPLALLQEVLAPIYFYHRYQLAAAAKVVGGVEYRYAFSGEGGGAARTVSAAEQRRALAALLETLAPEALDLSDSITDLILPRPPGHPANRELFAGESGPIFDPLAASGTAAALTIDALLVRERAARLIDQYRRDPEQLSFDEVLNGLVERVFGEARDLAPRLAEIRRRVQVVTTAKLLQLAGNVEASPGVRARVEERVRRLANHLKEPATEKKTDDSTAHRRFVAGEIRRFLERGRVASEAPPGTPPVPPGSPIGSSLPSGLSSPPGNLGGCAFGG